MGHAVHPGNLTQNCDDLYEPFASQMKILEMDQISVPLTARACRFLLLPEHVRLVLNCMMELLSRLSVLSPDFFMGEMSDQGARFYGY